MKTILCFGDSNTWGYDPAATASAPFPIRHPHDVRWTGVFARELGDGFRVIEEGTVRAGANLTLLERQHDAISLADFHATLREARPPLARLERLAAMEVLGGEWLKRLRSRLEWLLRHT